MSNSSKVIHPFFQVQKKQNDSPTTIVNNLSVYQSPVIKQEITLQQQQQPVEPPSQTPSPPPNKPRQRKAKIAGVKKTQKIINNELIAIGKSKKTVSEQPTKKKVFIETKKAVASCSTPYHVPMEKPKFYSDTLEYKAQQDHEAMFNFYGLVKKELKYDSDFSRLDSTIYGNAHERSLPLPLIQDYDYYDYTSKPKSPSIDIATLIKQGQKSFFKSAAINRQQQQQQQQPCVNKNKFNLDIKTQEQLQLYMNHAFPHWDTFPSCVILSQLIFNKSNNRQSNQQSSWNEKYRPKSINGLLGERSNSIYLKDWLHQMKISPMSAPKKKKKKILQLDELSLQDDDDDFMPAIKKKSAKQLKKEAMKSNIILLSGDHGVGKTALIYTAAYQLGYEIFEINSGSKRSGKDIMSLVGEMTKSHLVGFGKVFGTQQQQQQEQKSTNNNTMKKRKLNPCLSSKSNQSNNQSKDGLLKHFLRKKESPSPPQTPLQQVNEPKQSLILLEEVDLLFEEDKAFWTSVIELSQNSKRPIIMTCNDPEQIPFENLSLQVVLEINPPSDAELLPYLWLMCYSEGYIIDPSDLIYLIALLGRDIRQLIQTLELYVKNDESPIFKQYLNMNDNDTLLDTKLKSIPSRVAVDTFRLTRCLCDTLDDEDDFEQIEKALENNAFLDTWLGFKENGNMIYESVKDQMNGFTSFQDDQDSESKLILNELESNVSIMNSLNMKSNVWRDIILDEESHWNEICDARSYTFDDYTDSIMKLLPSDLLYRPKEHVIMMEYIPFIQEMISADNKSTKTRSKRKRLYLPLSDQSVEVLTSNRTIIDETKFWINRLHSPNS